jgi:hypothetical protein
VLISLKIAVVEAENLSIKVILQCCNSINNM